MNIKKLDTFGKRLEFIMGNKNVSRKQLAENLNLAPNSVSNYVTDNRKPDLNIIKNIACYLNVSADFLLGLTDDYRTYLSREIDGKMVDLVVDDEKLRLSEKEINEIFGKLKEAGFNIRDALQNTQKR